MLTFINKSLQLHEKLNNEDGKDKDTYLMEENFNKKMNWNQTMKQSKTNINTVLHCLKENTSVETHNNLGVNEIVKGSRLIP